ncbi:MAG: heavy-metal-associated domain-containing protein [Acidobacteria bacterium]|nr:heavy-metal-associated domain-containing protein [Acidobacteriota bacterium]
MSVFSQGPSKTAQSGTAKLQVTQCALKVSGMTCEGCAGAVKQGLLKQNGVKSARADHKSGAVEIEYDSKKTTAEKIVAAFNQASPGFRAELAKPKAK